MTDQQFFYTYLIALNGGIGLAYAISWFYSNRRDKAYTSRYGFSALDRMEQRHSDLRMQVTQLSYQVAYLEGLLNVQRRNLRP